ncbi:MAG: hypothetical protein IJK42_10605 [Prevotella sp.]|nr:hypothetical protein [Prevotella sp.]MBQ6210203.1 hypothetical protein [Prevotella sp.]
MKKTYQSPSLEQISVSDLQLLQTASGVYGDGAANDITYGGTDDGGDISPQSKPASVWDE